MASSVARAHVYPNAKTGGNCTRNYRLRPPAASGPPWWPTWSPDGRFLAYTADDDGNSINIRVLNVTTGAHVNIVPAWSPDGRRLAYVTTAPNGFYNIAVVDMVEERPGTAMSKARDVFTARGTEAK